MIEASTEVPQRTQQERHRVVLVVGLDLDDTSAHLLATMRDLTRSSDDAEVHVVNVVQPETFNERLHQPVGSPKVAERTRTAVAQWELDQLCPPNGTGATRRVVVHTPAGRPVAELRRIAREVGADAIVVEAHDRHSGPRRFLHRSVAASLARSAPCSVLTVRAHRSVVPAA